MNRADAQRILERAAELPAEGPVPSPCNCVCTMDQATGWCLGCLRTLDEIAAWSGLDDARRRDVWRRLAERARAG